jgi:dipeptidyl aminopeptidase/acylaminoacyl peptidase
MRAPVRALQGSLALGALAGLLGALGVAPSPAAAQGGQPRKLFFVSGKPRTAKVNLHSMSPDGSSRARLGKADGVELDPVLSPDGKRVAYVADAGDEQLALHVSAADGSGAVRLTKTKDKVMELGPQWSADGKRIYFTRMPQLGPGGQSGIYAIDPDGKNERRLSPEGSMDLLGGAVLLLGRSAKQTFKEIENKIGK